MAIFSRPSSAAHLSVAYVTIGALADVWSGIWYAYMRHAPPVNESTWYWCYGFFATGLAFLTIGLAIGRIGRSARHAELPPEVAISSLRPEMNVAPRPLAPPAATPANTVIAATVPNAVYTAPTAPPRS